MLEVCQVMWKTTSMIVDDSYSVCGFVKPGVNIATQISSMTVDINLLTKNDLIIFWCGSNDVSKNNSHKGLKHLVNFVQSNIHVNIVLMCVPPRHDLPEWSCVNNESKVFNRKLLKLMKPYKECISNNGRYWQEILHQAWPTHEQLRQRKNCI